MGCLRATPRTRHLTRRALHTHARTHAHTPHRPSPPLSLCPGTLTTNMMSVVRLAGLGAGGRALAEYDVTGGRTPHSSLSVQPPRCLPASLLATAASCMPCCLVLSPPPPPPLCSSPAPRTHTLRPTHPTPMRAGTSYAPEGPHTTHSDPPHSTPPPCAQAPRTRLRGASWRLGLGQKWCTPQTCRCCCRRLSAPRSATTHTSPTRVGGWRMCVCV